MKEQVTEGGCFCGAVRYRALGDSSGAAYCHCRTCRKSSGAPVTAWVVFPAAKFSFIRGEPVAFRSSAKVTRTSCGSCGTSLTCVHDDSGVVDITTPSLDEPEKFKPMAHLWVSHALPWVHIDDHLPKLQEGTGKPE